MSIECLEAMFQCADPIDMDEGMVAYERYHVMMKTIGDKYGYSVPRVTAVFCALSPNSDYMGNLRSTVTVLEGLNRKLPAESIVVSTYNHCKLRAIKYATGHQTFLETVKGPKIRNFYHNITNPRDTRWVTIDGHMSAIWQNDLKMTMREALIPMRIYREIKDATIKLAFRHFLIPNQLQAILWFTRKRLARSVFLPQLELFGDRTDIWQTIKDVQSIRPYTRNDISMIEHEQARTNHIVDPEFNF